MLQHVVFGICRLIDVLVPDIPESLELKIKRERYLAKQALQDSDTIMKVSTFHLKKQLNEESALK
jgi:anoctamin-7